MKSASRWLRRAAASAGVALAAACGGGGTEPPPPPPTVATVVITSPALAPSFASLGRTAQFSAEPRDANGAVVPGKTLTWSSNNTAVATVGSGSGLVTAVGNGTATISASVDGKTGQLPGVTVSQVTAQVVVTPPTKSFGAKGSTTQLTGQARDSTGNAIAGKTLAWSSGNTAVATVNGTGLVTSVADGTAQITASVDGQIGTASITVGILVATVTVTPGSTTLNAVGSTQSFAAQALDSNSNVIAGKTFTWASTNPSIVTVNPGTGLATSVANGTAQVQATTDAKTGGASVTVDILIATLLVSPTSRTFTRIAQPQQFTVTAQDANGNAIVNPGVSWVSLNNGFVTVSATGAATSVADGTTFIVVTATSSGANTSAAVTVAAVANSVNVAPASVAFGALGSARQLAASVLDSGNTAIPGRTVTWSNVTNTGAANVSASGLVTSVAVGSETVTATAAGPGGPALVPDSVPVTVTQLVRTVTVASARTTLFKASDTLTFTAAATDSNANAIAGAAFTWASTVPGVATVNATTGLATAGLTSSTTAIQATTGGVTGSKNLIVTRLVATVTVQSPGARINDTLTTFTGTLVYTGTALDSGGTAIALTSFSWSSSNTLAATVSPAAGVTTTASVAGQGPTTITGTASGKSAAATLVTIMPVLSFIADVQPILTTNCAVSLCHVTPNPTGNLNLTSNACTRIFNIQSSGTLKYILPGDPANSELMARVSGPNPSMPQNRAPLTTSELRLIRTWIQQVTVCN